VQAETTYNNMVEDNIAAPGTHSESEVAEQRAQFLNGDLDESGTWTLGDIDYDGFFAWSDDSTPVTDEQLNDAAVLDTAHNFVSYYRVGLDDDENANGDTTLFRYSNDINGDGEVYEFSEDLDGDTHFDTGEDRDHDGVWSVGDIDYNGSLGFGRDYEITSADTGTIGTTQNLDFDEMGAGDGDSVFDQFDEDIDTDTIFEPVTDDYNRDGDLDLIAEDVDMDGALDETDETTMTVVDQANVASTLNIINGLQVDGETVALETDVATAVANVQGQVTSNDGDIASLNTQVADNDGDISALNSDVVSNDDDIADLETDRQNMIDAIGLTNSVGIDDNGGGVIVSEVLAPTWNPNGTTYLDGTSTVMESVVELDTQVDNNATAITGEAATARAAEQANATAITGEAATARAAEQANATAITNEAATARAAEQANATAITNEAATARAAEQANATAITNEAATARAAEQANATAITNEAATARAAEQANATAITNEAATARAAEQANATAITDEAATARAAEQANATAITDEAATARAAEQANATAISNEAATARAAEQANATAITDEAATARSAEQANATAISNEATTARANETAISTALTAESNRAMNAEMANRSLINTNASDIAANQGHLRQLDADVDMLRSGVAMSMALAGMPTTDGDGTGFAIGVGNFDGESAVAMGFTHKSRRAAYKLGLTHAGGETGVSAGASWKISK